MVLDSRGQLLCSTVSDKHDVVVYDLDGKLLDTWKHGLTEPHGLTKSGEGSDQTLWLTVSVTGEVLHLDLDITLIGRLKPPPEESLGGKHYKPTETTVVDNGDVRSSSPRAGGTTMARWRYSTGTGR